MHIIQDERPRQLEKVAGEYYRHPYGGIARDIQVTRDGFQRFFEIDDFAMSMDANFYGKMMESFPSDDVEVIGYRSHRRGVETFVITYIDFTPSAKFKYVRQQTNKALMSDDVLKLMFG